jgi:hypothetical protein
MSSSNSTAIWGGEICCCYRRRTASIVFTICFLSIIAIQVWIVGVYHNIIRYDTTQQSYDYNVITSIHSSGHSRSSLSTSLLINPLKVPPQRQQRHHGEKDPIITSSNTKLIMNDATAFFNSIPINKRVGYPPVSTAQCIHHTDPQHVDRDGIQYSAVRQNHESWMFTSCHYTNLCWDIQQQDYVRFVTMDSNTNDESDDQNDMNHQDTNPYLAIGGVNPRWMTTIKSIMTSSSHDNHHIKKEFSVDSDNVKNIGDSEKMKFRPRTIQIKKDRIEIEDVKDTFYDNNDFQNLDHQVHYHQLPDQHVLVPFHSMAGHNVGHLLWDDFYPIYTLLKLFGRERNSEETMKETQQQHQQLLLIRTKLSNNQTLYANCDIRRNKRIGCKENFQKFLPLLGVPSESFSSTNTINITSSISGSSSNRRMANNSNNIRYVCARNAYAGIGLLTDHGIQDHGWEIELSSTPSSTQQQHQISQLQKSRHQPQYNIPHNIGRGRQFYDFSNRLIRQTQPRTNIKETISNHGSLLRPIQITFSVRSSRDWSRRMNFTEHISALQQIQHQLQQHLSARLDQHVPLPHPLVEINAYEFRTMSIEEQIIIAQNTDIFITACGGGAITATFLRRYAVVILFYDSLGGYNHDKFALNGQPAFLDWDLFNNSPHIRVHWLPTSNYAVTTTTTTKATIGDTNQSLFANEEIDLFVQLIQHEITIIQKLRSIKS